MNNNIIDYSQKVVEMRNITKKFGNFIANDNINLTVHKGEVPVSYTHLNLLQI